MKKIYIPDLLAVKTAVRRFADGKNKEVKFYPLFHLLRQDYAETPWPGNKCSVVYVIFDAAGGTLHIGTTESTGVGLSNYFAMNPDGTCRPRGNWKAAPAYLQVIGVGDMTDGVESAEDYEMRFSLRSWLQNTLARPAEEPWFRSLRDLLTAVTPGRLTDKLPWLQGSRQFGKLCRIRAMLLEEKLVSVMDTDRYYIMAGAVDFGLDYMPAVDYAAEILDAFDEGFRCRMDRTMKDISWMMNLRVYRDNDKMEDWQFFLFVMKTWFGIKLDADDEE